MNIGQLNLHIIYQANIKNKISRFQFLKTLGSELMDEHVKYRITIPAVRIGINTRKLLMFNHGKNIELK